MRRFAHKVRLLRCRKARVRHHPARYAAAVGERHLPRRVRSRRVADRRWYSWLRHASMNRITRWHQDIIKDDSGSTFTPGTMRRASSGPLRGSRCAGIRRPTKSPTASVTPSFHPQSRE